MKQLYGLQHRIFVGKSTHTQQTSSITEYSNLLYSTSPLRFSRTVTGPLPLPGSVIHASLISTEVRITPLVSQYSLLLPFAWLVLMFDEWTRNTIDEHMLNICEAAS